MNMKIDMDIKHDYGHGQNPDKNMEMDMNIQRSDISRKSNSIFNITSGSACFTPILDILISGSVRYTTMRPSYVYSE